MKDVSSRMARTCVLSAMVLMAFLLPACNTVEPQQVGAWREAVVAARTQSAVTFKLTNELVRASQTERAAALTTLTEADFTPGLDSDSISRWNAALDCLSTYAAAVEQLISPDLPKGVGESLTRAGNQIGQTASATLLGSDHELSEAIGGLGAAVTKAAANHSARKIMLDAQPHVELVLTRMAEMLFMETPPDAVDAESKQSGLLVMVETTWDQRLAELEATFADAVTAGKDRAGIVNDYASVLAQKQVSMEGIRSLRHTMLDLIPAHAAAAQGRPADLQSIIATIGEQIGTVKAVLEDIKKNGSKGSAR